MQRRSYSGWLLVGVCAACAAPTAAVLAQEAYSPPPQPLSVSEVTSRVSRFGAMPGSPAMTVVTCAGGAESCIWTWGEPMPEGALADLAFTGRKIGKMRCEFGAGLSPESTLTADDLEGIERRLRFDTLRRIEETMAEREGDFEWAELSCVTLAYLDELRWQQEREEKVLARARRAQQERRAESTD